MTANKLIYIITPTLGRSVYLSQTVDSVRRFGAAARHVIVCPLAECERLVCRFPGSLVVPEPSRIASIYDVINEGFRIANDNGALYVTWINDDDILEAGFAESIDMINDGEFDIVFGNVNFINSVGRKFGRALGATSANMARRFVLSGRIPFTQQGALISLSTYNKLGGFSSDFKLCADTDLFVRMIVNGGNVGFNRKNVACYRLHSSQLSQDSVRQLKEGEEIRSRHHLNRALSLHHKLLYFSLAIPHYFLRFMRTGKLTVRSVMNHAN